MAVTAQVRDERGLDAEVMWSDDGFVVRVPEGDKPLDSTLLVPDPDDVERLVIRQLGSTAMFAARFREAAGRALLLPRRRPGARAPLWQQRKRAADLLAVAARFGSFPMILEAYRECLRDVFDLPALVELLTKVRSRTVRVHTVDVQKSSPFAASLLFGYVANYLYDGDAPLAERRAHALSVDQAQLRRADRRRRAAHAGRSRGAGRARTRRPAAAGQVPRPIHRRRARPAAAARRPVGARDRGRSAPGVAATAIDELVARRRALPVKVAGEARLIAVEDAARYRDGLGTPLPTGLPASLLEPAPDAVVDLVRRYARTHGPFTVDEVAARLGLGAAVVAATLQQLAQAGRVVEGEFRPGGQGREWCDADVLRVVRSRSLAALRKEVEPVEPHVLGRFLVSWHGLVRPRAGLDALLDVVERLQGAPLVASVLEREVLGARVEDYTPALLDTLVSAGEVTWLGVEPLGEHDGRIALYLTDQSAAAGAGGHD